MCVCVCVCVCVLSMSCVCLYVGMSVACVFALFVFFYCASIRVWSVRACVSVVCEGKREIEKK